MSIAVALSGGLDSTALLYREAVTTDTELVAIHITRKVEDPFRAHAAAAWINRHIRSITLVEEPGKESEGGSPRTVYAALARAVASRGAITRLLHGRSAWNVGTGRGLLEGTVSLRDFYAQHTGVPMEYPYFEPVPRGRFEIEATLPAALHALVARCGRHSDALQRA